MKVRSDRSERGEAETRFFFVVLIICGLISGALWLLEWIRDSKDAKVAARKLYGMRVVEEAPLYAPGTYFVHCDRSLSDIIMNRFDCNITDDSYVEKSIEDFHLGEAL